MSELKRLPLDEAIRLRWVLRDIRARRFIVSPLDPADVQKLTQMGYVEIRDTLPALTTMGMDEI
ncbi:hypothetical protein [Bradyrhizobium sp. CCBAU 53421]|uniref:hypothetical protein n=1 Tax=Bradyrhizobium sp. CCBAU 53421 TaxID=1325120 RepID=UPI00188AE883|nr:hypothetical protein [Bradyrhizobium sp. CCBAU 53421]QOZ36909.1 hypothetical protein XH92_39595 [Bradyrhizobium sp. CCBAU 53421]